jgi:predicted RNase H-like nuclease (RuvC/YqgF family)
MNSKYQLSSPSLLPTNTKLWSTYRQIGWKEGSILCDYSINGCTTRVDSYEDKLKHQQECEYEPNYSTACENCESKLKKSELKYHNCVRELVSKIKGLQKSMQNLEEKVSQQTRDLDYVKQKLIELQSMQNKSNSDNMKSYTKQLIDKEVYFADDSVDHNEKYNSNAIEAQFDETKG